MNTADIANEAEIVWLHPKENYDYLREGVMECHLRNRFPKYGRHLTKDKGGKPKNYIVAYAVLKPDAESHSPHVFYRRYWWVKTHDRFKGHATDEGGGWYDHGCPAEAVMVDSVISGQESKPGFTENWT